MKIELPKEPVDRYEIKFWRVNVSEHYCYIDEIKMMYFVNTAYSEVMPTRIGAPLVNQWLVYDNGTPECRIDDWNFVTEWLDTYHNSFTTKSKAIEHAIKFLNERVDFHQGTIDELKDKIKELEGC